jgi:hypothetical protein
MIDLVETKGLPLGGVQVKQWIGKTAGGTGWREGEGGGAGEEGGGLPAGRPGCSGNDQTAGLARGGHRLKPHPQVPLCWGHL